MRISLFGSTFPNACSILQKNISFHNKGDGTAAALFYTATFLNLYFFQLLKHSLILLCVSAFVSHRSSKKKLLQQLLLKAVNGEDYEQQLLAATEFYGSDINATVLRAQLPASSSTDTKCLIFQTMHVVIPCIKPLK